MKSKKNLNFTSLRKTFSERALQIKDPRQEVKVSHEIHDYCLSGFAMMHFQDPSILEFQTRLKEQIHRDNLETLFNVRSIPKATQLRDVIDIIPTESFNPIFSDYLRVLQRSKQLEQFQLLDGMYLIPIDGTQYFSSERVSCSSCLRKELKNGNTLYYHQVIGAAIVHPALRQVIPLAPEPIQNIDGNSKQDCERNAGKRILEKIRTVHPKLKIIIAGDDLYSNQPFVDALKENRMSFILVAKETDHSVLFDRVSKLKGQNEVSTLEAHGIKELLIIYEWVNDVPLNGTKNADNVNFFECTILSDDKVTFHCSWVTDIHIDEKNIEMLVKGGRARWKIENENFNTLKNHGYHAEHNFGHGQDYASINFFIFILLAFFVHQILELTDPLFQKCRGKFSARKEFWNQLRCTIRIMVFRNWEDLMEFIISPEKWIPP